MRIAARLQAKVILAVLLPVPAAGHVKWFAPYDVSQPPLPLGGVLGHISCWSSPASCCWSSAATSWTAPSPAAGTASPALAGRKRWRNG
ncbi:hypothetical protein ACFQU2_02055 [Siccirubricoccus deserti]